MQVTVDNKGVKTCIPEATDPLLLPPNLAAMAKLASAPTKFSATGAVRLSRDGATHVVEATDGRVMARVEGVAPSVCDPMAAVQAPAIESNAVDAGEALVPADAWKEAFSLIPKRCGEKCEVVVARMRQNETTFLGTDFDKVRTLTTRNVEGRFPDTKAIMPKTPPVSRVRINADMLRKLLDVAAEFAANGTDEDCPAVWIELRGEKAPLVVRGERLGQKFYGMVCQLSWGGAK